MIRKSLKFVYASLILLLYSNIFFAQIPQGYYDDAEGLSGDELREALYYIIRNHDNLSYSALWTAFRETDRKPNGKVWDMYSDVPGGTPPYEYTFGSNQCGNYNGEGVCYNREHSFPKSWFDDRSPMYTDLFHLYPTDGYVNGRRSNYPFGEVGSATWTSRNGSKLGRSDYPGYNGTVFEPIDEYKGDFARSYFYMLTRYMDKISGWNSDMLSGDDFADWAVEMLLEWHRQDPVSEKEINRNNAVYSYQNNRNPFIDNPAYADKIWDPSFSADPYMVITYPADYAVVNSDEIQVRYTVSDFNLGTDGKTEYKLNDVIIDYTVQTTINIQGLEEGSNIIELQLVDNDNQALNPPVTSEVIVIYQLVSPTLKINYPEDNLIINTADIEVLFSVTDFELGSDGRVEFIVNNDEPYYTTSSPIYIYDLAEGTNVIELQLVDLSNLPLDPPVRDEVTVIYRVQTYVESFTDDPALSIFPNPANDIVKIEMENDRDEIISVFITDLTGKVIFSEENTNNSFQLNLSDKEPGIYFISLKLYNGDIYSRKLVIMR